MVTGGMAITVFGVPYMNVMLAYGVVTTVHSAVSYPYVYPGPNFMKLASWYQMASAGHSHSPMNPLTPSDLPGILSRPTLPTSEAPSPWSLFSTPPTDLALVDHNIVENLVSSLGSVPSLLAINPA